MKQTIQATLRWLWQHPWLFAILLAFAMGLAITHSGPIAWDDRHRYAHSKWMMEQVHFAAFTGGEDRHMESYSSIPFEFVAGILTEVLFPRLQDPYWLRNALNFTFYPLLLFAVYRLLRRCAVESSTAILVVAVLFGVIRFGGHASMNVKDFGLAAGYLFVSLAIWYLLTRVHERVQQSKTDIPTLSLVGALSVLPFLLRRPDISHYLVVSLGSLAYFGLYAKNISLRKRWISAFIPLLMGGMTMVALYPPLHSVNFLKVAEGVMENSLKHNGIDNIKVFGDTYPRTHLPRWYVFAWLPVMAHPFSFLLAAVGFVLTIWKGKSPGKPLQFGRYNLSLQLWLWIFVCISWGGFMILHPWNYHDERHQLFIYPILFVFAALGLHWIKPAIKYACSIVVVVASLWTYSQWTQLSYVYVSPLVAPYTLNDFAGDYWTVCIPQGVRALKDTEFKDITLSTNIPHVAEAQYKRLQESLVVGSEDFGPFRITGHIPSNNYLRLVNNRWNHLSDVRRVEEDIENGKAVEVWSFTVPTGEKACILAYYPNNALANTEAGDIK